MVIPTYFIFEVIADENNHGRHTILTTTNQFQALKLEREINSGYYSGALQAAEIKTTII